MTREEIWNKAEKRLYELYGNDPDLNILNRFLTEKMALSHFGVTEYFDELASICRESLDILFYLLGIKLITLSNMRPR